MKLWSIGQISPSEKSNILNQHKEIYNGYRTMQPQVSNTQPLYVQDFANDKGGMVVTNKGNVKQYTNFGINEQVESKEVCDECGAMEMYEGNGMCNECGGMMSEGECTECGWKGGDTMMEFEDMGENIHAVRDLNPEEGFDYLEPESSNKINTYKEFKEGQKYPHDSEVPIGSDVPEMTEISYPHDASPNLDNEVTDEYVEYDMMESAWSEEIDEVDVSGSQGVYGSTKPPYIHPFEGPGKGATYQEFSFESKLEEVEDWEEGNQDNDGWEELDEELYESFLHQKQRISEMMTRMRIL